MGRTTGRSPGRAALNVLLSGHGAGLRSHSRGIVITSRPALSRSYNRPAMPEKTQEDPRLVRFTKICLSLPEATYEYNGQHGTFQVRKKTFAYYLDNHHGDGIIAMTCKVALGENRDLATQYPDRFYLPAYLSSKGWVALRLDLGDIDWDEVADLVTGSYRLVAPKRLSARLGNPEI